MILCLDPRIEELSLVYDNDTVISFFNEKNVQEEQFEFFNDLKKTVSEILQ